jgi:hypothetical protein
VFDDLNEGQQSKTFAWYNPAFREVWFHYPSSGSDEPDRIARYNIDEGHWTPDTLDRTAAEYPSIVTQNPYLIDESGVVYIHENGRNDDGSGMSWQLTTGLIYGGSNTVQHKAIIPDYSLSGNMSATLTTQDYPKSSNKTSRSYTLTSTSTRVATEQNGRYWRYDLTGSDLNQQMEIGNWLEELKQSSPK